MRLRFGTCLVCLTLAFSPMAFSGAPFGQGQGQDDEAISKIKEYFENLGKYFGYDVKNYCTTDGPCSEDGQSGTAASGTAAGQEPEFSRALLNEKNIQSTQLDSYSGFLGALLGGANPLIPTDAATKLIQSFSAQTFPSYNSEDSGSGSSAGGQKAVVTVSPRVDQKEYQTDPVSQSILNMLSTPDNSYCIEGKEDADICKALSRQAIITNPWISKDGKNKTSTEAQESPVPDAEFPKPGEVFLPKTNQGFIPELNTNTFLMPLLYSSEGKTSQAQQAANFVRYVSGLMSPISTATYQDYKEQFKAASDPIPGLSKEEAAVLKNKAQTILGDYLLRIRMYAAQSSVALSNMYYMMARRLPQGDGKTSDALAEFKMATWRLFDFNAEKADDGQKWLNKIQKGSAASVQKEIAVLLAEINYQMYLQRQQNERMLLTQSIALIQMARFAAPNPRLNQPQMMP